MASSLCHSLVLQYIGEQIKTFSAQIIKDITLPFCFKSLLLRLIKEQLIMLSIFLKRLNYFIPVFVVCSLAVIKAPAQRDFIYSKEGKPILERRSMINNCLKAMNKDKNDKTALSICNCQVSKIDWHFTSKEYRLHTRINLVDIPSMIKADSAISRQIEECYSSSGVTVLLQAEGFEKEFISACKENIQKSTERKLDESKVNSFCSCQLNMVKEKKLTDAQMETLSNPNSLLFYEMMATCGDPFSDKRDADNSWNERSISDIKGPVGDTIKVLTLNGMTYVRIKTGSLVQFWLLDTGAQDLLINKDMETTLKSEGIISTNNYLGTGEYEMANGVIDTCRRYRMSNIQIGHFSLDNIVVAVTDKGKRIIAGKGLLNKFSNWILNNKDNTLILEK